MLIALQPDRGARADRAAEYHDPAARRGTPMSRFICGCADRSKCDALIHMGAHGTLEWLPGKSVALSSACWPDALLGATPVIYPFIVNNPGEAGAAKRRLGAVTIGHIPPPISAGSCRRDCTGSSGCSTNIRVAEGLDPRRRERLGRAIIESARDAGLDRDSGLTEAMTPREAVVRLDSFVCDVKNTLVADGLHIFGRVPLQSDGNPGRNSISRPVLRANVTRCSRHLKASMSRRDPPARPGADGGTCCRPGAISSPSIPVRCRAATATEQGKRLADALLTRHLQDHGDYPRNFMLDLWGSATMRTAGEEFAMALQLMGVAPVWDKTSDRVTGFDVITLAMLGRPRIDVTLRISGLFRDVFPNLPVLFEQAAAHWPRATNRTRKIPIVLRKARGCSALRRANMAWASSRR